jgi:four helix bundle suffix protein
MDSPFLAHGSYGKLRSYKVAEAVYDATIVFCRRFLVWPKDSREALAMRARLAKDHVPDLPLLKRGVRLKGQAGLSEFVEHAAPELAVNQAAYLLKRQLESQGKTFLEKGGFTEKLYQTCKARLSDKSDTSEKSDSPPCPLFGKPVLRRTARQGPNTGQSFWGCSQYPDCKGVRP